MKVLLRHSVYYLDKLIDECSQRNKSMSILLLLADQSFHLLAWPDLLFPFTLRSKIDDARLWPQISFVISFYSTLLGSFSREMFDSPLLFHPSLSSSSFPCNFITFRILLEAISHLFDLARRSCTTNRLGTCSTHFHYILYLSFLFLSFYLLYYLYFILLHMFYTWFMKLTFFPLLSLLFFLFQWQKDNKWTSLRSFQEGG